MAIVMAEESQPQPSSQGTKPAQPTQQPTESLEETSQRNPAPEYNYTPNPPPDTSTTPGSGYLRISHPSRAHFSSLQASYPLKLLPPTPLPSQPPNVLAVYTLAYGGGLVAGDAVQLAVDIDEGCGLVYLTQGSTKVFKHRPGVRPLSQRLGRGMGVAAGTGKGGTNATKGTPTTSSTDTPSTTTTVKTTAPTPSLPKTPNPTPNPADPGVPITRQRLHINMAPNTFLLLLPDSLSPFRGSRYAQAQRIVLPPDGSASALVLDWVNSGRGYRPPYAPQGRPAFEADEEVWAMEFYGSTNEIVRGGSGGRTVARERVVLDNAVEQREGKASRPNEEVNTQQAETTLQPLSPVAKRLAPYHVYATLLVYGPHFADLRAYLAALANATSQYQLPKPPGLIWSYSETESGGGGGGIIRVAGLEVEDVKVWVRAVLEFGGVKALVGDGLWPRCI